MTEYLENKYRRLPDVVSGYFLCALDGACFSLPRLFDTAIGIAGKQMVSVNY